jgi:hypothetical protein
MRRNVAGQFVGAQMITASDGSAFTGAVTVSVTGDAGTQAAGSVGSGACAHEGNGFHTYAPAQAETNYTHVAFTFTGTGAVPVTVQIYPVSYDASGRLDVGMFGGTAGTFSGGRPEVNTTHAAGTAWGSSSITAGALATDAVNEIADGILDRDMSTGADNGSASVRTVRQALRALRNKWTSSAGTYTVFKEDDSTTSWTSTVGSDAAAEPIISSDPASA